MHKKTGWTMIAVAAGVALSVMAQQENRPEGRQEERPDGAMNRRTAAGGMMGGGFDQSMFLLRIMETPAMAETLKLTDEQKEAFLKGMDALNERLSVITEALRIANLEQAALTAKIMADKKTSTNDLMTLVEKIGGLRTEQAKIQTEKLLVIRDTLTAEQIRSAGNIVQQRTEGARERMQQRGGERGAARGGERGAARGGERGAARGGDRRNTPLPERPAGWDE